VYGDLGYQSGLSIPNITNEVMNGHFDVALHVGDLAYDLHDNGDDFMNSIEDISARLPYMVAPGNHEYRHNFTHYRNRFKMPGNSDNYYYSWDVGPAHIISFSTEVYFFLEYGIDLPKWQYEWLEQDLKAANAPEQRAKRPWIITMGHRPMYCADDDGDDCNKEDSIVRTGTVLTHKYPLEDLFYRYGVDVEIWGHEHNYERFWPIYNRTVSTIFSILPERDHILAYHSKKWFSFSLKFVHVAMADIT
jgi:3',5'-cyclic AMP phosphodiesterase CpdA